MEYTTILTETIDKVGLVRLNRAEALNALNSTLLTELMNALETFDGSDAIGAIVITGSDKVFAAGADIEEMSSASTIDMLESEFIPLFDRIHVVVFRSNTAIPDYQEPSAVRINVRNTNQLCWLQFNVSYPCINLSAPVANNAMRPGSAIMA